MAEKSQYGQRIEFEEVATIDTVQCTHSKVRYVKTVSHGNVVFMDDEVQLSDIDEYRYHETLVHPVMKDVQSARNVLIIGGGDGCAAREVFKWRCVESVTVVDWDEAFVNEFGRGHLRDLNGRALERHNCHVIHADGLEHVRTTRNVYDVILIDLPDPDDPHMKCLYVQLLRESRRCLGRNGAISLHVGPAFLNPSHPHWGFVRECANLLKIVYSGQNARVTFGSVYVPSFSNEWAFLYMVCSPRNTESPLLAEVPRRHIHDVASIFNDERQYGDGCGGACYGGYGGGHL